MEFIEIIYPTDARVQPILDSYEVSFPENERRDRTQFYKLFDNKNTNVISLVQENQNIGYLILWKLSDFVFVEHFEVFEAFRNKKYGSEILQGLAKVYSQLILEIEPAFLDELSNRRYGFYQRNGFQLLDENYIQPSYGKGKPDLSLWLLGNFNIEDVQKYKDEIYKIVYTLN